MELKDIETRKAQIAEECKKASGTDLDKLYKEMNDLKAKEEEIRKQQDEMEKRKYIADQINKNEIVTKKIDEKKEPNNMYTVDSNEYRKAFMNYVLSGEMTPEFRSVATTADNGAVIPTAVMNTVVEKWNSTATFCRSSASFLIRLASSYRLLHWLRKQNGCRKVPPSTLTVNPLLP